MQHLTAHHRVYWEKFKAKEEALKSRRQLSGSGFGSSSLGDLCTPSPASSLNSGSSASATPRAAGNPGLVTPVRGVQAVKRTLDDHLVQFKFPISMTQKLFKEKILRLVCEEGIPFSKFDSVAFRIGDQQIAEKVQFPGYHRKGVRNFVVNFADQQREKLRLLLKGKLVYLLVDGASRQHRSFFGVNVAFFHEMSLRLFTLCVRETHGKHKSAELEAILREEMEKFGIRRENVLSVSADNASSMKAMVDVLNIVNAEKEKHDVENQDDSLCE
jgi:hypothetical protein